MPITNFDEAKPSPYLIQTRPSTGDLVGGISVALVLIPQAIAYATIAGLPPQAGLFAATLPLIVAAPFVSCPWLQTGPVALTSLLTYGALNSIPFETPAQMLGGAAILAIIVGCSRLLLGLFKLGGFTNLLGRSVVLGFTTAAAILIISSQLSKSLGTDHDDVNVLLRAAKSLFSFSWSPQAIVFAVAAALIVHFGRKIHRLFPSILLAVILAILFSHLVGYSGDVVGKLGGEFITFNLTLPWGHFSGLLFPGIVIAFIGFAEPASISMTLMEEENLKWNPNRELFGGGLANIFAGLVGGYPVGGSFSRTSINKYAGATTAWSGLITGVLVLALLVLTPYLAQLPKAALGAIIIMAVIRLIKVKEIYSLLKSDVTDGTVAVITLISSLATAPNVERGILIGVAIGLLVGFWKKRNDEGIVENEKLGEN